MELKNESNAAGLKIHTEHELTGSDHFTGKKKLRSSSSRSSASSPDSPLDDPFSKYDLDDYNESPKTAKHVEEKVKVITVPKCDNSNTPSFGTPTTNSKPPPGQTMERPVSSPYRIPSYVFARTKSSAPVEWSTASNESLFSIHMGDSSFGRDSMFNYNYAYNQPPMNLNNNGPIKENESNGAAAIVEPTKEVVKERVEEKDNEKISLTPSISCHSNHSDVSNASVHSFAFPVLTGNGVKDGSTNIGSVRIGWDYHSQQLTPTKAEQHSFVAQTKEQPPQPKASSSTTTTCSKWFGCFTCCTPCSR